MKKILIYSETEAAKEKRIELVREGNKAALRNPQYCSAPVEGADVVFLDKTQSNFDEWQALYNKAGVKVELLGAKVAPLVTVEDAPEVEDVAPSTPRSRFRKEK